MKIAIIGTGGIGLALAALFARHGHEVTLGSRDPEKAALLCEETGAKSALSYSAAAEVSDVIFFCIPWDFAQDALKRLGDLSGKVVIDASNPDSADGLDLAVGHRTSGAEILASRVPGAKVVKAFNYTYGVLLRDEVSLSRLRPTVFYCGDDTEAKDVFAALVKSCGLDPVDCGALSNARYLEPLGVLMVQLVNVQGNPPKGVALRLERIEVEE